MAVSESHIRLVPQSGHSKTHPRTPSHAESPLCFSLLRKNYS